MSDPRYCGKDRWLPTESYSSDRSRPREYDSPLKITSYDKMTTSCNVINLTPFENLGESFFKFTNINHLERIKFLIECKAENMRIGRQKACSTDERYGKDYGEPKDGKLPFELPVNAHKDASPTTKKVNSYYTPRPDNKAMRKLYYLCKVDEANRKSRSTFNQAIYMKNNFERVLKKDIRPKQPGRKYLHVFLPNVTRHVGTIETSCNSAVKKDKNSYNSCTCRLKSQKCIKKPSNKCELELPLVTFAPSMHHRSSNRREGRFKYGRTCQSQSNGGIAEKEAISEAASNIDTSKRDLYDVMKWKIL